MTISPTVYDWPAIVPVRQLFHAGGQAFDGGFTTGGAKILSPEPGGRAFLEVEFGYQKHGATDTLISWAMSKISNGNIFRVPVERTPQLLSAADLGLASDSGVPWAEEGAFSSGPWDNDQNWAFEVGAYSSAAALEGTTSLTIDMGDLPAALRIGHVIGVGNGTHLVDDLEWDGAIASITVDPPLRADVADGDYVTFRPRMLCVAENPENFRGLYEPADLIKLGSVRFIEAIL